VPMKARLRGRRVTAVFFSLFVAGITVALVQCDPFPLGGQTDQEVSRIESFRVDAVVGAEGRLELTETIVVNFPIARRGIFRIFDTQNPRDRRVEHPIEELSVRRDGEPDNWTWVDSAPGTETARIGRETVFLNPGTYTYELFSRTRDVLEDSDDPDVTWWWWDVIGSGWLMPIAQADIRVTLPAEPQSVECVVGEDMNCSPSVEGTELTLEVGPLSPNEPVTLRVGMPSDQVPSNSPGPDRTLPLSVGAGLLGALLGFLGWRATKERSPGFPVLYEPPAGIRPAVGVRVLDERASPDELQATLFDLGERGVLTIDGSGESWRVDLVADPRQHACEQWEVNMLGAMGLWGPGNSFTVARTETAGRMVNKAKGVVTSGASVASGPYLHPSGIGVAVRFFAWAGLVGLVVALGFQLFAGAFVPLPLLVGVAAFAVAGSITATDPGSATVRTTAGRDVWSRVGGFARFLSTESSESRFDAAAHLDWYPRYLPWALALGVGDEWTKRYEAQGVDPPSPPYVVGWGYGYGVGRTGSFSGMNSSFNSAIAGASAAYAAAQAKSSGGGGGFSGGSGGGGGGGGSW